MLLAQAVEPLGSNSTWLGLLLGGTIITVLISAYRFVVNFRTTERGMRQNRIREANINERLARQEATMWQNRCGDLEYLLRQNGIKVPPLEAALKKLVAESQDDLTSPPQVDWNFQDPATGSGGRTGE